MNTVKYTFIKSDRKLIKLFFDEILVIKGLGNYVEIFTKRKKYIYYKSLKELIDGLPDEFMRVHNSFIINLTNVDYLEDHHIMIGEHEISVAKSYRECLSRRMERLLL
ncbi:LytTR family transcriptional regulator [Flavobacterium sp. NST-5]|uniref:LytTR family transcriptional regulator n=1 Tax=Flavobacterium ichthyis TaxID=2698827 RepID=A0ABW9Z6P8_9FLAO|nr:LytTR family DNA-binding domain-containing protein [Flavobacterium ichthyis]NBL64532.1 LytTR family transcriptional regulator [Flavobacterium ichthyis]